MPLPERPSKSSTARRQENVQEDKTRFPSSITAPLEEQIVPPKITATLEQIVGQLDMLTQVGLF